MKPPSTFSISPRAKLKHCKTLKPAAAALLSSNRILPVGRQFLIGRSETETIPFFNSLAGSFFSPPLLLSFAVLENGKLKLDFAPF